MLVQDERLVRPKFGRKLSRHVIICIVLSPLLAGIFGTLIWLVLVSTVPRVNQPHLRQNTVSSITTNWTSPADSVDLLSPWRSDFSIGVVPLPCHSHNDYWRTVPLFEALAAGCTSVEADIYLPSGNDERDLLVGHKSSSHRQGHTLRNLYLGPLATVLDGLNSPRDNMSPTNTTRNWHGVFQSSPNTTFTLLLDFKSDGSELWSYVINELQELRSKSWLTHWDSAIGISWGPIIIVASGNAPFDLLTSNTTYRDIFYDAPLIDITNPIYNDTNSYFASASITRALGRQWFWRFTSAQLERMKSHIAAAKDKGLVSRYWETPSWPLTFNEYVSGILAENGVGILNVDSFPCKLYFLLQTRFLGNKLDW